MVHKLWIYLLWLLRYDFFLNIKLWLPVWTGSKGQIGVTFCKCFWAINDLYNGAKIGNLPLAVVEIWFVLNIKLWLPVWTGSKGQIGVTFCKYFLTINDLYNGAQLVNLPLVVVEIWFFLNIKLYFLSKPEVKGQIGVTFCKYFFGQLTICAMVQKLWIYLLWFMRYDLFKY